MKTVFKIIFFFVIYVTLIVITIIPFFLSLLWNWNDFFDSFDNYLDKLYDLSEATLNIQENL